MAEYEVWEINWKATERMCSFLHAGTFISDFVEGQTYITLSSSKRIFEKWRQKWERVVNNGDAELAHVGMEVMDKLNFYVSRTCTTITDLAEILDPSFSNDFICNTEALRDVVMLFEDSGMGIRDGWNRSNIADKSGRRNEDSGFVNEASDDLACLLVSFLRKTAAIGNLKVKWCDFFTRRQIGRVMYIVWTGGEGTKNYFRTLHHLHATSLLFQQHLWQVRVDFCNQEI